jgi:hypothetical protein
MRNVLIALCVALCSIAVRAEDTAAASEKPPLTEAQLKEIVDAHTEGSAPVAVKQGCRIDKRGRSEPVLILGDHNAQDYRIVLVRQVGRDLKRWVNWPKSRIAFTGTLLPGTNKLCLEDRPPGATAQYSAASEAEPQPEPTQRRH